MNKRRLFILEFKINNIIILNNRNIKIIKFIKLLNYKNLK